MSISLHNLKKSKGLHKSAKRVGRGWSSTSGKTSGRGQKGQKARSGTGGFKRLGLKRMLLATPKLRGFKSMHVKPAVVNLKTINEKFGKNELINPKILKQKGLIASSAKKVKILADGEINHAVIISGCSVSKTAAEKITAAGGTIKA